MNGHILKTIVLKYFVLSPLKVYVIRVTVTALLEYINFI